MAESNKLKDVSKTAKDAGGRKQVREWWPWSQPAAPIVVVPVDTVPQKSILDYIPSWDSIRPNSRADNIKKGKTTGQQAF